MKAKLKEWAQLTLGILMFLSGIPIAFAIFAVFGLFFWGIVAAVTYALWLACWLGQKKW